MVKYNGTNKGDGKIMINLMENGEITVNSGKIY